MDVATPALNQTGLFRAVSALARDGWSSGDRHLSHITQRLVVGDDLWVVRHIRGG